MKEYNTPRPPATITVPIQVMGVKHVYERFHNISPNINNGNKIKIAKFGNSNLYNAIGYSK